MSSNKVATREILARNIDLLRHKNDWSGHRLAKESGVAQRTINKTMNCESSPTAETISRIAKAFDLSAWQLLLPEFTPDGLPSPSLDKLLKDYFHSAQDGREYICRIAAKEATYGEEQKSNDTIGSDIISTRRM